MKRSAVLFSFLLACCAIGAVALIVSKHPDPSYGGRALSKWLYQTRTDIDEAQRTHAIQQIGTNALPLLLEWIQTRPSPLEAKLSDWLIPFHINPSYRKTRRPPEAIAGFAALGDQAKPAIPALASLLDSTNNIKRYWALKALGSMGEAGLPTLLDVVTNSLAYTNFYKKDVAFIFRDLGTNAFLAKPVMLAHLADPDPRVADAAIMVLVNLDYLQEEISFTPDATADIVPALCANLQSTNTQSLVRTIQALRLLGSNALSAVPLLQQHLTSTNNDVRTEAAAALKVIDPQALECAQKQ